MACRARRATSRAYGILGFGVLMAPPNVGAMDLRLCLSRVFFSQQRQQEEEEVLVPHGPQQELPNGAQPMEGLVGPSCLAISSVGSC